MQFSDGNKSQKEQAQDGGDVETLTPLAPGTISLTIFAKCQANVEMS